MEYEKGLKMFMDVFLWGLVIGVIHFVIVGILYGNPYVDKIYQKAQSSEGSVKRWESRTRYLVTQFLGTQVEVFILAAGFFWLKSIAGLESLSSAIVVAVLFSGIRVYPRFWNMWIQSTYPSRLLKIEVVNGIASTFSIVLGLYLLT